MHLGVAGLTGYKSNYVENQHWNQNDHCHFTVKTHLIINITHILICPVTKSALNFPLRLTNLCSPLPGSSPLTLLFLEIYLMPVNYFSESLK